MKGPSRWRRLGRNWPNRNASRFVSAAGMTWHVQDLGSGPEVLLLHGTGAATHSWGGLAPLLAPAFRVTAPDLPGHGFTDPVDAQGASLPGMASLVSALLEELEVRPRLVVGHSAGVALLVVIALLARMCLDGAIDPAGLVSLNGALMPFGGAAGPLFSRAAKLLASMPAVPWLVALHATPKSAVERMIRQTGSELSAADLEHYRSLVRAPGHVAATLRMMANWDLPQLEKNLDRLQLWRGSWRNSGRRSISSPAPMIWPCPPARPGDSPVASLVRGCERCRTSATWGTRRPRTCSLD